MDQWKQAKHLVLKGYCFQSIDHLLYFSTIEFRDYSNSLENVIKFCEVILKNISNWINFKHLKIGTGYILDTKTIKRVLNLQPTASPQIHSIPNTNLVIQFKRGNRHSNSLEITKN
ncbi:hypothetical protein CRE_29003 [Caenorhabditis remanei]|uniref:DUF38 domain-containing protein n=1 Tax=Caenorhabditis remanei TaxID=31234 RepID=E3N5F8_CAERE|nr:hypothetical protein CRE_29003 [Caenorhabditis remanei]